MGDSISMRKGFTQVDRQTDPRALVEGMDATAAWPAVQRLRRWERQHLALAPGDSVLDVGCGSADVLIDLVADIAPTGSAVGVDASAHMIAAARDRAAQQGVDVQLELGDAEALTFADATFAAVRCERALQWVAHPAAAVAEIVRVARPGGRVCVIDTDWRTLLVDHPSPELLQRFSDAMAKVRGDQVSTGSRLVNFLRDAALENVEATAETHMWLHWDPDTSTAPPGMVPLRLVAADLVEQGLLDATDAEQMITDLEQAARAGRFFASLTMFAASGVKPG